MEIINRNSKTNVEYSRRFSSDFQLLTGVLWPRKRTCELLHWCVKSL